MSMQPTFNAYGGERIKNGPGYSINRYSDQDIHGTLLKLRDLPEFVPGFLRWHELSPAQVVIAINSTKGDDSGRAIVEAYVACYRQLLGAWYDAAPLPAEVSA